MESWRLTIVVDYMDRRRIFTLDPERFPPNLVKDLVDTIHARDQHYGEIVASSALVKILY